MQIVLVPSNREMSMLTEQAHAFVDQLAKGLELIGVAIIVGGIALATLTFIRDGRRTGDWQSVYPHYRSNIGRGILLGLELLVGADIISTITAPLTFRECWFAGCYRADPNIPRLKVVGHGNGPPKMPVGVNY